MNIARRTPAVVGCTFVAAIAAVGCQKVPLLAPTGSTISLTASATALALNGTTQLIAQVVESSGTPPHSGTHVYFTTSLGRVVPAEIETDIAGRAVVVFEAGTSSGTATITASSGAASGVGSGTTTSTGGTTSTSTASNVVKIAVGAAAVGRVVVSANPALMPAVGGTAVISAAVSDLNGNALPSAPVTFSTDAGTIDPAIAVTDANGVATSKLTTTTSATVTASVGPQAAGNTGNGNTTTSPTGQNSGTVKVNVSTPPTLVIDPSGTTGPPSAGLPASIKFTVTPAGTSGGTGGTGTVGAAIKDLSVNWGDGTSQDLGAVASSATVSHVYRSAGTYVISAVLTDVIGNEVRQSTSVTVVPVPRPTIIITPSPVPGKVNTVTTITIQVTLPTGISVQDLSINFGDGQTADLGGANSASVPHVYTSTGTFTVTATVLDTSGQTTIGTTVVSIGP